MTQRHEGGGTAGHGRSVDRASAIEVGAEAELAAENRQLREALASRPTIDQAKGMLMLWYGLDADQAFALLSRWSQERNIKVRILAEAMVQAASAARPRDQSGALDPETLWSRLEGLLRRDVATPTSNAVAAHCADPVGRDSTLNNRSNPNPGAY